MWIPAAGRASAAPAEDAYLLSTTLPVVDTAAGCGTSSRRVPRVRMTAPCLTRATTSTLQAMRAQGAGDRVTLTDCVAQPAGHSQCVLPYWRFVLERFGREAKDL